MNVNCAGILGYMLGLVGAGMLGASIGTVWWQVQEGSSVGLFQKCEESTCVDLGWSIDDKLGIAYLICRVIFFASCLLCGIALVVGTASFCLYTDIKTAGGHHVSSGILILLGCASYISLLILYVGIHIPSPDAFGLSFYLCWGSGAVIILSGILELNGKKTVNSQVHPQRRARQQVVWSSHRESERQPATNPYYNA